MTNKFKHENAYTSHNVHEKVNLTIQSLMLNAGYPVSKKDMKKVFYSMPTDKVMEKRRKHAEKQLYDRMIKEKKKQAKMAKDYAKYLERKAYNMKNNIAPESTQLTQWGERLCKTEK